VHIQMFQNDLQRPTMRAHAFPVSLQIMVTLWFYATGSFQQVNADVHNISKGSVSNITKDVTQCRNSLCRQYIKMPTDRAELCNVMHGFHDEPHGGTLQIILKHLTQIQYQWTWKSIFIYNVSIISVVHLVVTVPEHSVSSIISQREAYQT
jgi:hypothetical protein